MTDIGYHPNTAVDFFPTEAFKEVGDEKKSEFHAVPSYARWSKGLEVTAKAINGTLSEKDEYEDSNATLLLLGITVISLGVTGYLLYRYGYLSISE